MWTLVQKHQIQVIAYFAHSLAFWMSGFLEIMTQAIQFIQQKVNILLLDAGVRDDVTEKVGQISHRLVANHQCASVHHARLQLGSDLQLNGVHKR